MLKEEVRKMLAFPTKNLVTKMNLIDSIQRLGVSYHFELEIDHILRQIHDTYVENGVITLEEDLHTLALLFRLLRQHGHRVSPPGIPSIHSNSPYGTKYKIYLTFPEILRKLIKLFKNNFIYQFFFKLFCLTYKMLYYILIIQYN